MLCRLAKPSSLETDFVEPGITTTSGLCAANHLSPAYFSMMESLKKTSPAGRSDLSLARFFKLEEFMRMNTKHVHPCVSGSFGGSISRVEKFTGFGGFIVRHLHANASRGLGIPFHAHRREFTDHNRVKACGLQTRAR